MGSSNRVSALFLSSAADAWGAEESMLLLGSRLPAYNIDPELWTPNSDLAARWTEQVAPSAQIHPVDASSRTATSLRWAKALAARSDAVSVVFSIDLAPLAAILRARGRGAQTVLDLHDYLPSRSGRLKLLLASHAYSSVIAISKFNASQARGHRHVTILRRPIEKGNLPGLPDLTGRNVGVVGRIDPDKRLEIVVEAMRLLPTEANLVVKGTASKGNEAYGEAVQTFALEQLGSRVTFTGRVERGDTMTGLDALIVANPEEAMGRTVLEAQIAGVPVIVPNRGGAAELVEDQRTGHVFTAGDPRSLATSVDRALHADLQTRASARLNAIATTDPDKYAEEYARVIRRLAANGADSP